MELEGFGASLVGHVSWVIVENERDVWLPWEFLTGATYQGRILMVEGREPDCWKPKIPGAPIFHRAQRAIGL